MEIIGSSEETLLNVVRLYKMEAPPSRAFDMSGSLHLIIDYLLKGE